MNILNMWLFTSFLNSSRWSSSSKPMRISADNSLKLAIQKLFKWLFCQKGATHLSAMDGKQKSFRAGQRQDMTKGTAGSKAGGLTSPRVAAKAKGQGCHHPQRSEKSSCGPAYHMSNSQGSTGATTLMWCLHIRLIGSLQTQDHSGSGRVVKE